MNPKFTLSITTGICLSVLTLKSGAKINAATGGDEEKKPTTNTKSTYTSRNNHAVKIYPDVVKKAMHVIAKENDGKKIDFFVFDLQGTLLKHYKMDGGDHEKITGLKRGKYIYNVFSGDEETAAGKFEIR
jgi:hypothetical protein